MGFTSVEAQLFGPQSIIGANLEFRQDIQMADLDGDGDLDLLLSGRRYNQVGWFENTGSSFGDYVTITEDISGATAARAADFNGDGLNDIVCAAAKTEKLFTLKNLGGGIFQNKVELDNSIRSPRDLNCADIDGDGYIDISCAQQNKVILYRNDGSGAFGAKEIVASTSFGLHAVDLADIDADGDLDVISTSFKSSERIAWHENLGSAGFATEQAITTSTFSEIMQTIVADIDNDSNPDILTLVINGSNRRIKLIKNSGGGVFGPEENLISPSSSIRSIAVTDFDADGLKDLLYLTGSSLTWQRNLGSGNFGVDQFIWLEPYTYWLYTADFSGDGVDDVIGVKTPDTINPSEIISLENTGASLSPAISIAVIPKGPTNCVSADMDNDGDNDIVVANRIDNRLIWYENAGGGEFNTPTHILAATEEVSEVSISDMDNDGLNDIICGFNSSKKIVLLRNLGGGIFSLDTELIDSTDSYTRASTADLDMDGYEDVVYATVNQGLIWQSAPGSSSPGAPIVVSLPAGGIYDVETGDLNGDGLEDILFSGHGNLSWFENLGTSVGSGFGPKQTITGIRSFVRTADLDGDNDLDLLTVTTDEVIAWYENDGLGNFTPKPTIGSGFIYLNQITTGDLDDDGDLDVIAGSSGSGRRLIWYENFGSGSFGPENIISTAVVELEDVAVSDLDGNGSLDIISVAPFDMKVAWYRNLSPANCNAHPINLNGSFLVGPTSGGSISLSWSTVPDALSYQVKIRRVSPGPPKTRNFVATANSFIVTSALIMPEDIFEWKVRTSCAGGTEGEWSSWLTLTIPVARKGNKVVVNDEIANTFVVQYYPNPTNNFTTFVIDAPVSAILSISDITGKVVGSLDLPAGVSNTEVDFSDLPTGIYYYSIGSINNRIFDSGALIVE